MFLLVARCQSRNSGIFIDSRFDYIRLEVEFGYICLLLWITLLSEIYSFAI